MAILEQIDKNISFAIHIQDDFSKEWRLIGSTKVFIAGSKINALENPSGYHIFMNLSGTKFKVRVENRYYFDWESDVDISVLPPRNPVVAVNMKPTSLYPFPAASTLIRGKVIGPGNIPIAGAEITIVGSSIANRSEADGRFVLFFGPLTEDEIVVAGSHRNVKVGSSTTLSISVQHTSYTSKSETIGTINEGGIKLLTSPITLS